MRDFMVVATCCIYMRRLSLAQAFVADLHVAQSLATQKMKTGLANTPPTKGSSISGLESEQNTSFQENNILRSNVGDQVNPAL